MVLFILTTPALSSAATLVNPLSIGSRGAEVTSLQQTLFMLGYFKAEPTGYFGNLTREAVAAFQNANDLETVGSVGAKTRALLNALASQAETSSTGVSLPSVQSGADSTASTSTEAVPPTFPAASSSALSTDTTPPAASSADALTVTLVSPPSVLPINTLHTTLTVATNKSATCRWGTTPNTTFGNMTQFVTTGGTIHSYTLTNLTNGYWYVYYVKCQDNASLTISADTMVSFTISWQSSALSGYTFSYVSILSQVAAAAATTASFEELKRILDQILVMLPALIHS